MAADIDGAITRVRRWLRGTVPGDLARVVGTGDGVATDDVAAVLDALDAAQRSAATERAAREAAEGECERLRGELEWTVACRNAIDAMLDEVRAQRDAARADRDAAVARCTALAGAVRRERATRAAWLATLPPCATAPAEVLAAEAATRAALDALLTEGTRSVADEAECDDCGDDMASGYFDPMARCPRHRP